jgi:hypothetical protein
MKVKEFSFGYDPEGLKKLNEFLETVKVKKIIKVRRPACNKIDSVLLFYKEKRKTEE